MSIGFEENGGKGEPVIGRGNHACHTMYSTCLASPYQLLKPFVRHILPCVQLKACSYFKLYFCMHSIHRGIIFSMLWIFFQYA